jgi:hypothetical protein
MATAHTDRTASLLARALTWTLWWSAWLVLGDLGPRYGPVHAGGVLPLAAWLLFIVVTARAAGAWRPSTTRVCIALMASTMTAAAALRWACVGGGETAVLLAAAIWGIVIVFADLAARAIVEATPRSAVEALPAALGAAVAWAASAANTLRAASLVILCGSALAALCGQRGVRRRGVEHRGDPMPLAWSCLAIRDGDWVAVCARAAMVPMMASLTFMPDWCAAAGSPDRSMAAGVHLALMLLLPGLLHALDVRPTHPVWLALPMGAGLLLLASLPGVRGWMAASLAQSLAWGMSFTAAPQQAPRRHACDGPSLASALAIVAAFYALGTAASAFGPIALSSAHAALGIGACVACTRPARPSTRPCRPDSVIRRRLRDPPGH